MLNVIYHKTFKETGRKECICDEEYRKRLDYIEWFNSPDLVDRKKIRDKEKEDEKRMHAIADAVYKDENGEYLEDNVIDENLGELVKNICSDGNREKKILNDLHVVYEKDELEKKKRGRPKVKKE